MVWYFGRVLGWAVMASLVASQTVEWVDVAPGVRQSVTLSGHLDAGVLLMPNPGFGVPVEAVTGARWEDVFRVARYDPPGIGGTALMPGVVAPVDVGVAMAEHVCDGHGPVTVVGFSSAANLALRIAAEARAGCVNAVVAVAGAYDVDAQMRHNEAWLDAALPWWPKPADRGLRLLLQVGLTDVLGGNNVRCGARRAGVEVRGSFCTHGGVSQIARALWQRAWRPLGTVFLAQLGLTMTADVGRYVDMDLPASLETPVLAVHGRWDRLFDVDIARAALERVPNACAHRFVLLNASSHNVDDDDPVALERLVVDAATPRSCQDPL